MKIRLVLAGAVAALLTGMLATSASAADSQTSVDAHKVCIEFPTSPTSGSAPGYCIWWNGAAS
jgi:hypothetical protein